MAKKKNESKFIIPERVKELTKIFTERGFDVLRARRKAWNKHRYENSTLWDLSEKPKVLPLHGS